MQKKSKRALLAVLFFLMAAGSAAVWYWATQIRGFLTTDNASIDGLSATVSSQVLGRILSIEVDEGDSVDKGQLLIRLDDSDLLARRELARSSVISAEKTAGLTRVNLERARIDYERLAALYKEDAVARERIEHSLNSLQAAEAQLDIDLAEVETARAELRVIDNQLGNTLIKAPIDGVVSKRWLTHGEIVDSGQAILTIHDIEGVWVTAHFEETKISKIRVDTPVSVSVDAFPGKAFPGKIACIGSSTSGLFSLIPPNNAAGNFTKITQRIPVRISLNRTGNPGVLLPGMSATVRIDLRQNEHQP
jgi:membrane fusion protein (multidrug efflux system)